ncbi:TolC family protein [Streptomyces sp. L7]
MAAQTERARLSQLRFERRRIDIPEVLDAQRDLLAAQQQLVQVRRALLSSRVGLYAALGGGTQAVDSVPDPQPHLSPAPPPARNGRNKTMTTTPRQRWIALLAAALVVAGGAFAWKALRHDGPGKGFVSGNGRIEATEIDAATNAARPRARHPCG